MGFAQVRQDYDRLTGQLAQGQIGRQAFLAAMAALRTQGPDGRWWTIDANTGRWLVWQNNAWEPGQPPTPAPPKAPPPPPPVARPPAPGGAPAPTAGPTPRPARPSQPPPGPPPKPAAAPPGPPPAPTPAVSPPQAPPAAEQRPPEELPEELPEGLLEMPSPAAAEPPEPAAPEEPPEEPLSEHLPLPPEGEAPPPQEPEPADPLERVRLWLAPGDLPDWDAAQAEALALLASLGGPQPSAPSAEDEDALQDGLSALRRALRETPVADPDAETSEMAPAYLANVLATLAGIPALAAPPPAPPATAGDALLRLAQVVAQGAAPAGAHIAPQEPLEGLLAAATGQAQRQMSDSQVREAALAGSYGPWLAAWAAETQDDGQPDQPPLCIMGTLAQKELAELAEALIRALNSADAESSPARQAWFR